jgi:two-component system OmpR family sensor kinase
VRAQIRHVFDGELKQIARAVHVREDWINAGRMRIARPGFSFSVRAYDRSGRMYFETVQPAIPPEIAQTFDEGYQFVDATSGRWRLYTYFAPEGIVQVGQPLALRDALARDLSLRVVLPLLLLIPVLAIVIIWGLRQGLLPLKRTAQHVSQRDATALDPLPSSDVPGELLPLVDQINGLMMRLGQALDAQRSFLAIAAHELRSPVAALSLQAQVAERAPSELARQAAFAELRSGIERTTRLVQQLLDFARLERGLDQEAAERVDVARIVRETVGLYAPRADALGVDLGADTPPAAYVMGSDAQLRSMIGNLLDNALRYTPRGGMITAAVRGSSETLEVEVTDSGPGIPSLERERVFNRFHRVPGDRTPGNGLGLSIVKAIVERHAGSLSLGDVHPGSDEPGLSVRIKLPVAQTAETAQVSTPISRVA